MPVGDVGLLEVLQNAAAATANGAALAMAGRDKLTVEVSGTFSATVTFEGTVDDTSYFAVGLLNVATGVIATTATTAGAFKLPADLALSQFRARVSAYTSGNVTVKSWKEYG